MEEGKGEGKEKKLTAYRNDSLFPISCPHHFVASHAFVHYLIT